ncbi:MAG: efflux RND transporter periplasmic adaptor subunit [Selenomonadaceae bacterium]|nr:efflux RND transporter periplasmic adaptor subunit [Selenomonadaceae bacterium]
MPVCRWKGKFFALAALLAALLVGGCGGEKEEAAEAPVPVKVMRIAKQSTPNLFHEFPGNVESVADVVVQSKVSGRVVEKYISGGEWVKAGQPLYRLESKQYESDVMAAQANLENAQVLLQNARIDLMRNEELLKDNAISEQQVTTQKTRVKSCEEEVAAKEALLQYAQQNLDDTIVYAPMDGKLALDDVSVGTYTVAGQTHLVTITAPDPIYVTFAVTGQEYLWIASYVMSGAGNVEQKVTLTLANGEQYPHVGHIVQSDRALAEGTGTLTVKAIFPNPDGVLLPGMFTNVKVTGGSAQNAILVPKAAVQELLGKQFVLLVDENHKSTSHVIKPVFEFGDYYLLDKGVSDGDIVIVDGLASLQNGKELDTTLVTPEEMGYSMTTDSKKKQ